MEEQNNYSYCPKCGMKNYSQSGYCMHCGYNKNAVSAGQAPINSNQQVGLEDSVQQQSEILQKEKIPTGAKSFLVFSIIGALVGLPLALKFGVIWMIFGAFGDSETTYYAVLYVCFGIVVASIISLPAAIINIILKGRHTKKCILFVIVLTVLGLLLPSIMRATRFSFSDIGLKKAQIKENKVIYQDDQYTVKQREVKYNDKKIIIKLEINGDIKNVHSISGRINKCYVSNLNFKKDKNNIYTISISKDKLDYYQITEPKEIELNLPLSGNKTVTINTNKASSNNQQQLSFEEDGLLYKNEYFEIYYNPEFKHDVDIYIKSLVSENYYVSFKNLDFDTPGYLQSVTEFYTKNYNIQHMSISFYPCKYNLSYLKGEYKIIELANRKEISSGIINEIYTSPKIDTRRCRATS